MSQPLIAAAALAVTAGAICIESAADFQLRRFLSRAKSGRRLIDEGLWKLLRYPN